MLCYLFWMGFEPLGGFLLILDSTAFLVSFMAPLLLKLFRVAVGLVETEAIGINSSFLDRVSFSLLGKICTSWQRQKEEHSKISMSIKAKREAIFIIELFVQVK